MKFLIAPDKFKGSLSAAQAAQAIAAGIGDAHATRLLPIADGGEGTAAAVCEALQGEWITHPAPDPLHRLVECGFAWVTAGGKRTAVLEMSQASGLWRLAENERDPWRATTVGTGHLIREAIRRGAEQIILGLGGSATNEGGSGLAQALGYRFLDEAGREIAAIPENLLDARRIDATHRLPLPKLIAACDVTNPLLGPAGATRVYGPQKGVEKSALARHEERLTHLADLAARDLGRDFRHEPGAGAAGGLGFGCLTFADAQLRPGFELVSQLIGLEAAIRECDAVITGEGSLDAQTLHGKGPHGVAQLARRLGKQCYAFAGRVEAWDALRQEFDAVIEIRPAGVSAQESMARAAEFLEAAARESGLGQTG